MRCTNERRDINLRLIILIAIANTPAARLAKPHSLRSTMTDLVLHDLRSEGCGGL